MAHMKRREFISLLGSAATAWPLAARAQQGDRRHRIGVMSGFEANDPEARRLIVAFKKALQDLGWIDGRDVEFDYRWSAADPERIRSHAIELARARPSLILVNSTPATRILHREIDTVPVVFVNIADPVRSGFVKSLANPGGNLTGLTNFEPGMGGKWLELLKEIAPERIRAALIFNPDTHSGQYFRLIETVAPTLRMEATQRAVQDAAGIERAITSLGHDGNAGIVVMPDNFAFVHRDLIVALAAQHRVPAIYPFRTFVAAGGLISYGIDDADLYRRAASYVGRILKGTKPADLPVELPTKFELAINLKAAKALGLEIPPTLLARADEVIE
jgi:putative tryptophan/tyrosine transport system substrate-binding protein